MSNEREKAELGADTLRGFCESWGNDVHANIMLEVLFKGLMNEENLFVFGKSKQKRCENDNSCTGGVNRDISIEKHSGAKTPPIMGKKDTTDYP
jgi:hypothetical protein